MATRTKTTKRAASTRAKTTKKVAAKTAKRPGDKAAGAKRGRAAVKEEAPTQIVIPPLTLETIDLRVRGVTPLVTHAWSDKAKNMLLGKQMGKATAGKEVRDPHADFINAAYILNATGKNQKELYEHKCKLVESGKAVFGFPCVAFKSAAVDACSSLKKSITKVLARQAFHVLGYPGPDFVQIHGECRSREDMVRIGMGIADVRFRPEFVDWYCDLRIQYNSLVLTAEQVINLFNVAGYAVGIGEMRPGKTGFHHGMFEVEQST